MNPLRRYEAIMEQLLASKEVTVADLSDQLQVTGKTIREDLAKLEERGLLVRVHGGAVLAQSEQLGILSVKEPVVKHSDEKAEVAERALRYIEPKDIIALDGGSTTLEIARRLDNIPLTVITNDVYIIGELARKPDIRLVVPGGYRVRNMLTGPEAESYVRSLNVQKAFLSATGVHPEYGFSIYTGDLIAFKRALLESTCTTYVVADHHKFGQFALRTFAELKEVSRIITDSGLTESAAQPYTEAGVEVEYGDLPAD
ncbi:DeoR/GlpR transcriptional regulator [Paenibacillus sambharensis]|uniref:DeoR/GlpR transcriptional regulator n=1 Tax=Paenibacillus sambharensis TaxID=1803190 RepID=A0A2W1LDR1_9BACL|nr:DeoR/GlpR family DNA-binding transcription regulator [Paenibacillus sambharensis]PZD93205.1 DeoR/GlpR transcriptional regulator [Paenibacillus sambharensis]